MFPPTFLEFSMAYFGQFIQYEFYSAMKAGHSAKSQKPAGFLRNHLLACSGIGCCLPAEWGAGLDRILHERLLGET